VLAEEQVEIRELLEIMELPAALVTRETPAVVALEVMEVLELEAQDTAAAEEQAAEEEAEGLEALAEVEAQAEGQVLEI